MFRGKIGRYLITIRKRTVHLPVITYPFTETGFMFNAPPKSIIHANQNQKKKEWDTAWLWFWGVIGLWFVFKAVMMLGGRYN